MAGISDVDQDLCLALALWNGRDPILKERMFGLTGPAGQPRRGRQGVLVVPRRAAEPLVAEVALPLPAGRVPLRATWSPRTAGAAAPSPSTSCSTPASSTRTATGWSRSTYAKADPHDLLHARSGHQRRAGGRHPARAADAVVPQHLVPWDVEHEPPGDPARRAATVSRRPPAHWAVPAVGRSTRPRRRGAAAAVLRERDQRRAAVFGRRGRHAVPQGRHQRPRRGRRRDGEPRADRAPSAPCWYQLDGARRARPSSCGCGCGRLPTPPTARPGPRSARRSTRCWPSAQQEADEFYARAHPRRPPTADERLVARQALRRDDLGQAVLPLRRAALAGRRPDPAAAAAGAPARRATPAGAPRRLRHPVDARPVGVPVVRRVGPRLPHRRVRPHRPGVREVPAAG